MTRKERFGKLVLLAETDAALLGTDYRAAKLGATGLEKMVTLLRLRPAISAHPEAARSLMDQVKIAAQLQNSNILKIIGIGKVDASYYVTYEFLEGRTLQQILDRCRQESYPFAIDHALLIASKVCAALEHCHARKTESGRAFHGLLAPATVLVSFDGEVRLKGFGYWQSRVREAGLLLEPEQAYLAPEQMTGPGETRSDFYGLGAILYETLTGHPPARGVDPEKLVAEPIQNSSGEEDVLPKPIADILRSSLAPEPGGRYADVAAMKKAIDTVLFSGDFTPTTFNLAFFMHSLFREDMEGEAKALQQEREASYAEYLDEPPRAAAGAAPAPSAAPAVAAKPAPPNTNTEPFDPKALLAQARSEPTPPPAAPVPVEAPVQREASRDVPEAVAPPPAAHPSPQGSSPGLSSREAASSFTFHREEGTKKKSLSPLVAAGVGLVLLAGGVLYFATRSTSALPAPTASAPTTTLAPEVIAAQQRVKELEEKLASLEAEKRAAEVKAAEDAKSKVEAQAKAKGQEVDQAALQRAQDDARQRARQDEDRKQREELRRVEEQKRAEEALLAEERRRAEEAAAAQRAAQERAAQERAAEERAAQATPTTPPPTASPISTPEPPPTTAASLRPGTLVGLSDPGVIPPVLDKKPVLAYPPIALRQRAEGTVDLNLLVDEKGNVTDAQVVAAPGGRAGLPEAAQEYARRWKYRPATKDGVPVKVWTSVRVRFELPR
jgi:TonB family protein